MRDHRLSIGECYRRLRYSIPLRIGHKACEGDFLSHKKARSEKKKKQCMLPIHEATPLADATCALGMSNRDGDGGRETDWDVLAPDPAEDPVPAVMTTDCRRSAKPAARASMVYAPIPRSSTTKRPSSLVVVLADVPSAAIARIEAPATGWPCGSARLPGRVTVPHRPPSVHAQRSGRVRVAIGLER